MLRPVMGLTSAPWLHIHLAPNLHAPCRKWRHGIFRLSASAAALAALALAAASSSAVRMGTASGPTVPGGGGGNVLGICGAPPSGCTQRSSWYVMVAVSVAPALSCVAHKSNGAEAEEGADTSVPGGAVRGNIRSARLSDRPCRQSEKPPAPPGGRRMR